jgi:hypothetical protein
MKSLSNIYAISAEAGVLQVIDSYQGDCPV